MAQRGIQRDQIVKLIVGAGQASPSPPVGPALGSKGVKSMDFCKVSVLSSTFFCALALATLLRPGFWDVTNFVPLQYFGHSALLTRWLL